MFCFFSMFLFFQLGRLKGQKEILKRVNVMRTLAWPPPPPPIIKKTQQNKRNNKYEK